MNILGIIPARGGSKGVLRKNIRELCGHPLIYYSISEAKKSKLLNRVVVSTEDSEIAAVAQGLGAEVIPRPQELASDSAGMVPVLEHAVKYLEQKDGYKTHAVMLLPPTCPLRTVEDIDNCAKLFMEKKCDSVVAVYPSEHPPFWALKAENGFLCPVFARKFYYARKQDLPQTYLDGPAYVMKPKKLFRKQGFVTRKSIACVVPRERGLDIDTEFDMELCEFFMKKRAKV
jgi:CMP-N,N'-diacetyllegionaminic acid synthase